MAIETSDVGFGVAGLGALTWATGAIGWSVAKAEKNPKIGEEAVADLKANKIAYQKLREKNLDARWSKVDDVWGRHSKGKIKTSEANELIAALKKEVAEFFKTHVKSNKA